MEPEGALEEEDGATSVSGASLTEDEVAAALRQYRGVLTRKTLQKARGSRARKKTEEKAKESNGPTSRRRFYAMTSDDLGREKALDGSWIDKLQDLLDDTADAYGARTEWQAEVHDAEQKELRDQIGGYLANFFQAGSESIDTVTGHLVQVWRCLNTPGEAGAPLDQRDVPPDFDGAMREVMQSLKEARQIGSSRADKMTYQWFAYLTKEVFKVEEFGEHQRIHSLDQLKTRLRLHHSYEELMERWHRMDNLNAGLEEAVNNKAMLKQAAEHAESLLNKQIEAQFHKNFQKETKQLVLQAAKARADLVGQVENQVRHRGVLRSELLMHLGEFSEKLKNWHPKTCKKFHEGINALKSGKRQADNRKRVADESLGKIRGQLKRLQSELDHMLTPYTGSQLQVDVDLNTFEVTACPTKPLLISRILATVAECEDSIVPSMVLSAVKDLVNRSPLERLQQSTQALVPERPLWQDTNRVKELLDFDATQQRLGHRAAAAADVAHFLVGNKGVLLLRGPERSRLEDIIRELRNISAERTFGHSATTANKLLKRAENLLKVLSAANCRGDGLRRGCVGAEAALIMALLQFGGMMRAHRGCKLLAALHSLRSLQLRKQALSKVMESQTESSPPQEQVSAIEAAFRATDGSLGMLAEQAEKLASEGNAILAKYSQSLEQLLEVTQQLALNRRIDVVTSKGITQERIDAHGMEIDAEGNSLEIDLFPDLPALLAAVPQSKSHQSKQANTGPPGPVRDGGVLVVNVLKYQQAMLKMHLNLRKWLRCALLPNMADEDFEAMEEAMEATQTYLKSQLPADETDARSSSSSATSEESGKLIFSPRRSNTLGALSRSSVGDLAELHSMTPRTVQGHENEEIRLEQTANTILRERSVSDLRHDRRLEDYLARHLSERFTANAEGYLQSLDDSHSHADADSPSSEEVVPYEILEKRSEATFLKWSAPVATPQPKPKGKAKAKARGGLRHGSNWAARDVQEAASSSSPSPRPSRSSLISPRIYRDLAGRKVAKSSRPASAMRSEALGATSESDAQTSPYTGDDSSPERVLWTQQTPPPAPLAMREAVGPETREATSDPDALEALDRHQRNQFPHSLRHRPRQSQEAVDASSLLLATSTTARGRTQQQHRASKPRSQSPRSPSPTASPPMEPLPATLQCLGTSPSSPFAAEEEEQEEEAPPEAPKVRAEKQRMLRAFSRKHQPTENDLYDEAEEEPQWPLARDESQLSFARPESAPSGAISSLPDREELDAEPGSNGQAEEDRGEASEDFRDDPEDALLGVDDGLDGVLRPEVKEAPELDPTFPDGAGSETSSPCSAQAGRLHHASLADLESGQEPELYSQSGPSVAVHNSSMSRSRKRLLAEKAPVHGRAFPAGLAEADRSISGPPGTARRLLLHSRPGSAPKPPRPRRPEAEPAQPESPWLPWPESLASRFEPDDAAMDQLSVPPPSIEVIPAMHAAVKIISKTAPSVVRQLPMQPASSHVKQQPQESVAPEVELKKGADDQISLPVRIIRSQRQPTKEMDRLISDGNESEQAEQEQAEDIYSAQEDSSLCPDAESLHLGSELPSQRLLLEEPQPPVKCEVGPVRKGLPMTRRGVMQLLSQHEAVPAEELSGLSGEAVGRSKPRSRPATASMKEAQIRHFHSDPRLQALGLLFQNPARAPVSAELLAAALAGDGSPTRSDSESPKNQQAVRHSVSTSRPVPAGEDCVFDNGLPVGRDDSLPFHDLTPPGASSMEWPGFFVTPRRTRSATRDENNDDEAAVSREASIYLGHGPANESLDVGDFRAAPEVPAMPVRKPKLCLQTVTLNAECERAKRLVPVEEAARPRTPQRRQADLAAAAAVRNIRAAALRQWESRRLCTPSALPSATVAMATVPENAEESLRSWQLTRPGSAPSRKPNTRPKTPRPAFGSGVTARGPW